MQLDTFFPPETQLKNIPEMARAAEQLGFKAIWMAETQHNPFLLSTLVAEHTHLVKFGTAIAVSFARSPAVMAQSAWDLAALSNGRFVLGLGTQVKAHIERRFGMGWPNSPVGKLREQIAVLRAFWRHWQDGEKLNVRGDYYNISLSTPFFNPAPIERPGIPVMVAGVNPGLAALAGEVADGFLVHPYHSPEYLEEILMPAIRRGVKSASRIESDLELLVNAFVVTNDEERKYVRQQIAFYASTPSYRAVMAHHGWAKVAQELSALAARQRWNDLPSLISDEVLQTFATVADEGELATVLRERYANLAHRLNLYIPFVPGQRDTFWRNLIAEISSE